MDGEQAHPRFLHWSLPPGLGFEAAEAPGVLLCGSAPTQGQEPEGWACRTESKCLSSVGFSFKSSSLNSELGVSDHTHPKRTRLAELGGLSPQLLPTGASLRQEKSSVSPHPFIYQNLGHPQWYFYFKCCSFCEL